MTGANLSYPAVVGTVHSSQALKAAQRLRSGQCDWLELRVDNFFPQLDVLLSAAHRLKAPVIVTVRHSSEGGAAAGLANGARRDVYRTFFPVAGLVDLELKQVAGMRPIIREAKENRIGVILSFHDFRRTPELRKLTHMYRMATDAGADIFKVATTTRKPKDLSVLLEFLNTAKQGCPLSVMGMGVYGKVSRLLLAQGGSCLNYGYLGSPNASGQWPATVLKARIAELRGDENGDA